MHKKKNHPEEWFLDVVVLVVTTCSLIIQYLNRLNQANSVRFFSAR